MFDNVHYVNLQPIRWPPRTRIEDTVVDLTQCSSTMDQAIGWITKACGRRLTTVARLRVAFDARPKLRWRYELGIVLADVADGCDSVLEVRFLRDVERPHGLPKGTRQVEVQAGAERQFEDIEYEGLDLVVELDGRLAHPDENRVADRRRDKRKLRDHGYVGDLPPAPGRTSIGAPRDPTGGRNPQGVRCAAKLC